MNDRSKINFLYTIYRNRQNIVTNTHCALVVRLDIEKEFWLYGPNINWFGRKERLLNLYNRFKFAKNYVNEWGYKGFKLNNLYLFS